MQFQKYADSCGWGLRGCLNGGGGPQVGEVTCGGSPHLSSPCSFIKFDKIKQNSILKLFSNQKLIGNENLLPIMIISVIFKCTISADL